MTRFVVCGETLIDLIRASEGPQDAAASTWSALSAGGPMNSAVALGRLGMQTQFLGRLGSDAFGEQLRSYIDASGVGLDLAVQSSQSTSRTRQTSAGSRKSCRPSARMTGCTLPHSPVSLVQAQRSCSTGCGPCGL